MTAFFGVHLVLTVASLTLGTIIGVLGIRALRLLRRRAVDVDPVTGGHGDGVTAGTARVGSRTATLD